MGGEKLRVGIVGLGKMGLVHTSILSVLPNVEVVGVCDKSDLIRRFFKKVLKNVPIVNDVEKLLSLALDVVYVTTPIPYHYSVARTIYQNKITKNVFVEKTLAASYKEAEELCGLARRSGGANMVGYLRRFYVTFVKAKNLLDEGKIGDMFSFKAYAFSSDFVATELENQELSDRGGVLADLGSYAMDLASWFFGDISVKSARAESFVQNNAEVLHLELNQDHGVAGICDVSWSMKDYRMPEVGFTVEGSKGAITVNDDWVELRLRDSACSKWYRQDLNDNVPFWLGLPEYYREDKYFINCLLHGCESEPCFESASKIDKMIEDIKSKLRKGD